MLHVSNDMSENSSSKREGGDKEEKQRLTEVRNAKNVSEIKN